MTAATAERQTTTIGSLRLAELLGISYRRLDYAVRCSRRLRALDTMAGGSGSRRRFDADVVLRLAVAVRLTAAVPFSNDRGMSCWPQIAGATMNGPTPPASGFAIVDPDGTLTYRASLDIADVPVGAVGVVVRYDVDLMAEFGLAAAA